MTRLQRESRSGNKLLVKTGAVLGAVSIPVIALGACGAEKPPVVETLPGPAPIGTPDGNNTTPTETQPVEKPTETPGSDDKDDKDDKEKNGDGLRTPESFINYIKNWGYSDVKYIGQRTLSNNVELQYAYECKTSSDKVVWSVATINTGDGAFVVNYDLYSNPLG